MRRCSFSLLVLLSLVCSPAHAANAPDKWTFWSTQRKGANCFNLSVDRQYFADARAAGISLVRLTWSKWKGEGRDFLLGNADDFSRIPPADLAQLRAVLDAAHAAGVQIVLTPLSLPGLRWRQQNDDQKFDDRLWRDEKYHAQSAAFWRELAAALRDHPAIVGYNLINEPAPARALKVELPDAAARRAFDHRVAGTPADVNRLYRTLVAAVREVDASTPIVLDAADFAAPEAIDGLAVVDDARTLYAVHCYTPWEYTAFRVNGGKRRYPGEMEVNGQVQTWDRAALRRHLEPVAAWAKRHDLPAQRIFVAEFGCDRRVPGAREYLADLIDVLNEFQFHWAFYGYREDEWDGFDYELGTGKLPWSYWQAVERGEKPAPPRKDNPLWQVIAREFAKPAATTTTTTAPSP